MPLPPITAVVPVPSGCPEHNPQGLSREMNTAVKRAALNTRYPLSDLPPRHARPSDTDPTQLPHMYFVLRSSSVRSPQELSENMGLKNLRERFNDPYMAEVFQGMFPTDNPRNTRFAINFFTAIGLGGLTDGLRLHLKNAPKMIMEAQVRVRSH